MDLLGYQKESKEPGNETVNVAEKQSGIENENGSGNGSYGVESEILKWVRS